MKRFLFKSSNYDVLNPEFYIFRLQNSIEPIVKSNLIPTIIYPDNTVQQDQQSTNKENKTLTK